MADPENILNDILNLVNADSILTDSFIMSLLQEQEYMGFSAIFILRKVKEFLEKPSTSGAEDPKISIFKLIALGMYRGNNVSRMIKTSKPELRAWLAKMVTTFEIRDKVGNSNTANNEVVTLSRIRMALPQFTFKLISHAVFQRQINVNSIRDEIENFKFMPNFCRDMSVMSLLPKKQVNEMDLSNFQSITSHIFIYCYCESKLLKSEETKNDTDKTRAEKVSKYMSISWSASHITTNMRKTYSLEMTNYINELSRDDSDSLKYQTININTFAEDLGLNLPSLFSW